MWELDCEEGWALKNWCFWTVVLEKTLESPLDCKIKPVNPKRNQPWIVIGRTDAEAEAPILWPPDAKSWLTGSNPDAGKDRRQEEKGATEEEMVGWHHWLNGHEFEQALGDGEGQESLACCSPQGCKDSDTTERLNNKVNIQPNRYKYHLFLFSEFCVIIVPPKMRISVLVLADGIQQQLARTTTFQSELLPPFMGWIVPP